VLLAGLTGTICLAAAGSGSAGPSAAAARPRVFLGDVRADTLQATPQEVRPAAALALEKDHWVISPSSTGTHVVTEWKDFSHPLARLLMGKLRARCVVDIQPLDDRLTLVRFQGGIASETDVQENPVFSVAQSTYRGAVQDFYHDLATGIAQERSATPSKPAGASRVP
jgi:hypothetical protein